MKKNRAAIDRPVVYIFRLSLEPDDINAMHTMQNV